jgi:hypothetical protein
MKNNTRDYGKDHPRFVKGYAEGGVVGDDQKPIPLGTPGTWSDLSQASEPTVALEKAAGVYSRHDRPIKRSGYPR